MVVLFLTSVVTGLSVNVELNLESSSVAGSCLGGETLGLTNTSVLVEYRLLQIATLSANASETAWRFLAEVNASQGFDQNLTLDIEVPVDFHGFQLKLLQTAEHGGGGCNCWRVASLAISNCSNGSYNYSDACRTRRGSDGSFCLGRATQHRGMVTAAFYCSELSSDKCPMGSNNLIPSKGSALPPNCDKMSPRMYVSNLGRCASNQCT